MKITITQKQHYGTYYFYPNCDNSELFIKLTGRKTLTFDDIKVIKGLGYEVEVAQESVVKF
jgi:hypothetical protein|tara:strand:- start:7293 stop:7475 length:183 start_codon:yes stop_codon:yes gene_type:complete